MVTRRAFVKLLAGGCAGLTGCDLTPSPPARIGASIWPGYECLFVARSLGLFDPEPVKLVEYPSNPEAARAFRNGAVEAAALTLDEFLRLAEDEPEVRAILVTDISKGADALLGREEHRCVTDLRGKRVGVEVNACGVYLLARALAANGLTKSDVEVIAVDSDEHVAAYTEGRVDALVTFEPHRSKLLRLSARVLFDTSQMPGELVDVLVARQSFLESRPECARAIVKGWFKARERLLNEGEDMARLVASREGVTPEEFLKSLELIEIPSAEKNRQMLGAQGTLAALARETHRIMKQHGLLRGGALRPEWFDGGYLP